MGENNTIDLLDNQLIQMGFALKNNTDNAYVKKYPNYEYEIVVELDEANPKKSIINYGPKIKTGRKTTSNFSQNENIVVLECVNRLLEKGYNPESIELEKSWNLGHKSKGFLDILVKDKQGKSLFMIECKNWGGDFHKEKNKMFKDGGQLLSYYRQEKSVKCLCLYTSKLEDGKVKYNNELIDTKHLKGENEEEIFDSWDTTFNTKGIFEHGIRAYEFKNIGLVYKDLEDLEKSDGQTIFHHFAEILRKHVVSDKPNAFNKIFNLFICKIQDEDENFNGDGDLFFQFKPGDDSESLFDRLNTLYKKGLENYIDIILPDINEKEFEELIKEGNNENLKEQFRNLRYYRSSQEFAFKDVYNKETFEDNATVVKEVVKLLQPYKIKYSKKHQHLGDFFELLLNTGFKQESGQYFTPIPLTRFICKSLPVKEIIERKNNSNDNDEKMHFLPYVIDYASGSGHFITEMMDEIDYYVQNIKDRDIQGGRKAISEFNSIKNSIKWASQYVYAIEKDYRLVKISKVSSFLNGDGDANVMSVDGLASFKNDKYKGVLYKDTEGQEHNVFDILIANPPYSVSGFKHPLTKEHGNAANLEKHFELAKQLTDKSSEIECLFVERAKQLLKERSVAGIILPISILTNGGIYERTREIILNYFNIKAIVSLGNNAFMATGTKTIVLFLEKKKSSYSETKRTIQNFFSNHKDVICGGIKNAFSTYVKNIYEDIEFKDYVSLIQGDPNARAKASELYKEYKDLSHKEIIELEKEKLLYFITSYSQQVVVADSGEKATEKEFYGYEFSNRRGHEGIHIYKDEEGSLQSKLYNDKIEALEDTEKLNSYILRNFRGDDKLIREIEAIQTSEQHPLKEHIHYTRLSQLMSFNTKRFDKTINLNKKKDLKIESKWGLVKLGEVCDIEYGERIVRSREAGNLYPVYGGGGETFKADTYNRENRFIISRFGMSPDCVRCIEGKFFLNDSGMTLKAYKIINQDYLDKYLLTKQQYIYICGRGVAQKNIDIQEFNNIKIPLPPLEIQQKIIDEIDEIENKEEEAKKMIESNEENIEGMFTTGTRVKLGDVLSLEYGISLPKNKRTKGIYPVCGANGVDGFHNEFLLEKPSIIVGRKGSAGKINWMNENCTPIDTTFYVKNNPDKIELRYAFYILNNANLENLVAGIGTPGLNRNNVYDILLPIPLLPQQKKIIAEIEPLEKEIAEAKNFLSNGKNLKQDILDKYLK